jgi:two-component system response regulator PilR (NtrC family)
MAPRILVVDDDENVRETVGSVLTGEGYSIETASSGAEAIEKAGSNSLAVMVTDLKLPDTDGVRLYQTIKKKHPDTLAIIITGHASLQSAIRAIKAGAYDYLEKPFRMEDILLTVKRALDHAELLNQNIHLRQELKEKYRPENIVGAHPKMQEVFDLIRKVAAADVTVLIRGESGTGKELAARAIHYASQRKNTRFVALSCGALPETLLESELFGYEKGAFTGAVSRKPGLFETADGGSLFLDEIGDLSPATQVKLLRVLQEREFQLVGGIRQMKVDVRLLSATNKDLEKAMREGSFRKDLYYRLNVLQIELPPLRERKDDIPLLVKHFLAKFGSRQTVLKETMNALVGYDWPGNVRELENAIERAIVLAKTNQITTDDLPDRIVVGELARHPLSGAEQHVESLNFRKAREKFEKQFLQDAVDACAGNIAEASRRSGISRRHLYQKLNKYHIRW